MALPKEPESPSKKEKQGLLSRKEGEYPIVERQTVVEVPPEIEKVEAVAGAEATLAKPVTDDAGQVLVSPASPQQVTVTLPLTEEEMQRALHLKLVYSIRWLAEWTARMLKKAKGKFVYKLKSVKSTPAEGLPKKEK